MKRFAIMVLIILLPATAALYADIQALYALSSTPVPEATMNQRGSAPLIVGSITPAQDVNATESQGDAGIMNGKIILCADDGDSEEEAEDDDKKDDADARQWNAATQA